MKEKIIFLVIILFTLTGCEINYTLDIDKDNLIETTAAIGNPEDKNEDFELSSQILYDEYINKPIPIFNDVIIQAESNQKLKGITYYKKENLSDNANLGIKYNGEFNFDNITKSTIINYAYPDFSVKREDDNLVLETGKRFKLFEQYPNLEKVTINIKTNRKVIDNNADKISNHIYTWTITKDNYLSKPIKLTLKQDKNLLSQFQIEALIALGAIVFIITIIILFMKYKQIIKNQI